MGITVVEILALTCKYQDFGPELFEITRFEKTRYRIWQSESKKFIADDFRTELSARTFLADLGFEALKRVDDLSYVRKIVDYLK